MTTMKTAIGLLLTITLLLLALVWFQIEQRADRIATEQRLAKEAKRQALIAYRNSLTQQVLEDEKSIDNFKQLAKIGVLDLTNATKFIGAAQSNEFSLQNIANEFDRTNTDF
jgi:hypothetical protein